MAGVSALALLCGAIGAAADMISRPIIDRDNNVYADPLLSRSTLSGAPVNFFAGQTVNAGGGDLVIAHDESFALSDGPVLFDGNLFDNGSVGNGFLDPNGPRAVTNIGNWRLGSRGTSYIGGRNTFLQAQSATGVDARLVVSFTQRNLLGTVPAVSLGRLDLDTATEDSSFLSVALTGSLEVQDRLWIRNGTFWNWGLSRVKTGSLELLGSGLPVLHRVDFSQLDAGSIYLRGWGGNQSIVDVNFSEPDVNAFEYLTAGTILADGGLGGSAGFMLRNNARINADTLTLQNGAVLYSRPDIIENDARIDSDVFFVNTHGADVIDYGFDVNAVAPGATFLENRVTGEITGNVSLTDSSAYVERIGRDATVTRSTLTNDAIGGNAYVNGGSLTSTSVGNGVVVQGGVADVSTIGQTATVNAGELKSDLVKGNLIINGGKTTVGRVNGVTAQTAGTLHVTDRVDGLARIHGGSMTGGDINGGLWVRNATVDADVVRQDVLIEGGASDVTVDRVFGNLRHTAGTSSFGGIDGAATISGGDTSVVNVGGDLTLSNATASVFGRVSGDALVANATLSTGKNASFNKLILRDGSGLSLFDNTFNGNLVLDYGTVGTTASAPGQVNGTVQVLGGTMQVSDTNITGNLRVGARGADAQTDGARVTVANRLSAGTIDVLNAQGGTRANLHIDNGARVESTGQMFVSYNADVTGGGTIAAPNVLVADGGALKASATILGDVRLTRGGTISPYDVAGGPFGTLGISGDLDARGGLIALDIGANGSDFIDIGGAFTFDQTTSLSFNFVNGYQLDTKTTYDLFSTSSLLGDLKDFTLAGFDPMWSLAFNNSTVSLTFDDPTTPPPAVPLPATGLLTLAGLGALGLVGRRRRKH